MANKNILVSNNGKYEPISASVDDVTSVLSSSLSVTANTSSFVAQSGIMEIYNGKLMPVGNSSILNPQNNYSGSLLSYDSSEGFGPSRTANAAFSGDISGDTAAGIKVRSVSNVTGGILQSLYGGTGTGSFSVNSLITTSGSGLIPNLANKVVIGSGFGLAFTDSSSSAEQSQIDVYLYTGSINSSNIFTWNKPQGYRFVRVICQGGGAGGEFAYRGTGGTTDFGNGAGGGGGGGYSDVTFNYFSLPQTVIVTAGAGGSGGITNVSNAGQGASSSFGNFIYANGGTRGIIGDIASTYSTVYTKRSTGGAGGIGYNYNGGNGGAGGERSNRGSSVPNIGGGDPGSNVVFGGAGGGGGGSVYGTGGRSGAKGGDITQVNLAGGVSAPSLTLGGQSSALVDYFISIKNVKCGIPNTNNFNIIELPDLISAGGGGGGGAVGISGVYTAASANGGSASFGSGGGGAACAFYTGGEYGAGGGGGNGGNGYVLIICY